MFRKIFKLNTISIILTALLISASLTFCLPAPYAMAATNEILKPTAYTFSAFGTNQNPASAYDFATGGDSTTYNNLGVGNNNASPTMRYRTWQTSSNPHSSRTLYIRRQGTGNNNDWWRIQYSTNNGSSYTVIETNLRNPALGNSLAVSIPTSLNLSLLIVRIDTVRQGGSDGGFARIYDVWLDCELALPRVGTQISAGYPIVVNPSPMTPQQEWTTVTVPVWHGENISSIDAVEIKVFFDSAGSDPDESGFSPDAQTCVVFTWTRGGSPEWDMLSAGATWDVNDAGCSKPGDAVKQGNWVFSIKIGKVATYSAGSSDWDIYAIAFDYKDDSSSDYLRDVEMNWYGEVSVSTITVDWWDIVPGSDFNDTTKQTDISVVYIANGVYYQKVASGNTWTGSVSNCALNTGGTPGNLEFSLKADDTDNLTAAVLVNAYPTYITIGSSTQTDESGEEISSNTIWLKLGAVIPNDTFSGTIYYMISATS